MKKAGLIGLLLLVGVLAGCLPAVRRGEGRLVITVNWRSARAALRGVEEIHRVTAYLSRQSLRLTVPLVVDQAEGAATGRAEGLYAGEWQVKVEAATADGTVVYAGQTKVNIITQEEVTVSMVLTPAPGSLALSLDVTPLLAQGLTVTGGRVYIYGDPTSGSATVTKDMTLRGDDILYVLVENLAPKTYEAKVAVPSISNPVFTSAYFSFAVLPGRTSEVHLVADGRLNLTVEVIDAPAPVTGLTAVKVQGVPVLSWTAVDGATGYRVYRTDAEGRFRQLTLLTGGENTVHTDETFPQAPSYGGMVGYAVAALVGELEGLRSAPVMVPK